MNPTTKNIQFRYQVTLGIRFIRNLTMNRLLLHPRSTTMTSTARQVASCKRSTSVQQYQQMRYVQCYPRQQERAGGVPCMVRTAPLNPTSSTIWTRNGLQNVLPQVRYVGGASQRSQVFKDKYQKNKETQARRLREEFGEGQNDQLQGYETFQDPAQEHAGKAAMGLMAQLFLFGFGVTIAFIAIGALFGLRKQVVIERDERPRSRENPSQ